MFKGEVYEIYRKTSYHNDNRGDLRNIPLLHICQILHSAVGGYGGLQTFMDSYTDVACCTGKEICAAGNEKYRQKDGTA